MKHIKLFEGFERNEVKKGMKVQGGMGTSFEEGTLTDVSKSPSNMVKDKKKMSMFHYTIKVTKQHSFSKKKIDTTEIQILAVDRADADRQFLERLK